MPPADDDRLRIEQPAAIDQTARELGGEFIPDFERNGISGLRRRRKPRRGTLGVGFACAPGGVELPRAISHLFVSHIALERPVFPCGPSTPR